MRFWLILLIILCPLAACGLYQSSFYDFDGVLEYNYQTYRKESKEKLFAEKFTLSKLNDQGREFLVIQSSSQALAANPEKFDKETITYYLVKGRKMSTYCHENKTVRNKRPFLSLKIAFDWAQKKANYRLNNQAEKRQENYNFNLSDRTMLTHDLGPFFQDMVLNQKKDEPFTVVFPTGRMLNLRAKVAGNELVKTRSGEYLCEKIEMKPDFNLLALLAPTITFWFMTVPPYTFVKYEGPERGFNSPAVVQELVGINKP
ncbi:MAG: hypothetical protein WC840_06650 [Candidatus Peribacteraceae bacterium]